MVAFIDDDEFVLGEELGGVFLAGDTLDHGDVDDSCRLGLAASDGPDLVGFKVEVLTEAIAPLVDEFLSVDQDEGWDVVVGDHGAGDHGFACAGRGDDHASLVWRRCVERVELLRS